MTNRRSNPMFGCQYYGFQADIMVLSKQITSTYQPLAAIVVSDVINDIHTANNGRIGSYAHSFTRFRPPLRWKIWLSSERQLVDHAKVWAHACRRA
ncbi:adenosylmethionine-8-amino-7-oxononanoate aminotransferase [Sinorhizobium terangae]|uniref:Aminotransferase class III-fold pyridoxal phosphate-dependent enzyme n=1 Tax=Sinorhizobium terangae TaxID=110322 RepID=A0A6N7LLB5_SINTE|nr:aminotransferase class III-fold pyridoxal phosphate-dependent enzyme [Sinorhizobium terangae]MBB4188496.1 adenosylmethionine-8-amino-7-oxononanoate aminotransferase [Sinorhizobium terangae]MQX18039.1 aminotransferase class III-fold pyridoxal phosphate-dependent enzyme [Sinorhizobium terangae]